MLRPTLPFVVRLAIALVVLLLPYPARAAVDEPLVVIFADDFGSGDVLNWSAELGPVCPAKLVPAEAVAGFVNPTLGSRIAVFRGGAGVGGPNPRRSVAIEVYEEFGGPISPAVINLGTGDNTNYATCGTCVLLFNNGSEQIHFQSAGSLTITELDPVVGGTFAGTFAGTLIEVTIDPTTFVSTPVPGGCSLTESNYAFSATLDPF